MITFQQSEATINPHHRQYVFESNMYGGDRPIWVKHLRIYQRVPCAMSGDTWSVLYDAIIEGNQNAAGMILASDDIMPGWRRSSILINNLTNYGTSRMFFHDALAGSIWDFDLGLLLMRADGFRLVVSSIDDQPITIRPFLVCEDLSREEIADLRAGRQLREGRRR